MYRASQHALRRAKTVGVLAVALAMALAVLPVAQASASFPFGVLNGFVIENGTANRLSGIKVQAFSVSGSAYTPSLSTYTDASGNYAMAVPSGTYRVVFSDPTANPDQVWADLVWVGSGYLEAGTNVAVIDGTWSPATWAQMNRASLISVNVKRAGQWATPLKGVTVSIVDVPAAATRTYTTGADGSVLRGGVPADAYRVTLSDPSGKFGSLVLPGASLTHALTVDDEWTVDGEMPLLHSSANIGVSKPASASSVKHGVKLGVSGMLSKRVTTPKKMRLDAYQWSPSAMAWVLNKTATLKISKLGNKSVYSGSIRLPNAGKWRLVAVFGGNSKYAQSGSTYRELKVK
jgi:hypothetical protein